MKRQKYQLAKLSELQIQLEKLEKLGCEQHRYEAGLQDDIKNRLK